MQHDAAPLGQAPVDDAPLVAGEHPAGRLDLEIVLIRPDEGRRRVRLSDGSAVEADVSVVGIGVVPNTEWLASSGLAIDDGVVCAETTATSAPGIVAVGDVA
ncbi:MAG: hypothetical protein E4H11_07850, partial [Myxococcales bacterium]